MAVSGSIEWRRFKIEVDHTLPIVDIGEGSVEVEVDEVHKQEIKLHNDVDVVDDV